MPIPLKNAARREPDAFLRIQGVSCIFGKTVNRYAPNPHRRE